MWRCILANVWSSQGNVPFAELLLRLRADLFAFYSAYKKQKLQHPLTELKDITAKMLGNSENPKLKTKGAETWGFFLWLVKVISQHRLKLGAEGPHLQEAARALEAVVVLLHRSGKILTDKQHNSCAKMSICGTKHNSLLRELGRVNECLSW